MMKLEQLLYAKKLGGGSGGVSSWNDLADRPFYNEPAFEPIMWDGNTEGLESVDFGALLFGESEVYYKINDQAIPEEKFIGSEVKCADGIRHTTIKNLDASIPGIGYMSKYETTEMVEDTNETEFMSYLIVVLSENDFSVDTGIYICPKYGRTSSTGFGGWHTIEITPPITTTFNPSQMPEGYPYDARKIETVSIEWDGNTTGIADVSLGKIDGIPIPFFKISDLIPTDNEIGASTITMSNGESFPAIDRIVFDEGGAIGGEFFIVIREPGNYIGASFPEPGLYFPMTIELYVQKFSYPTTTGELKPLSPDFAPEIPFFDLVDKTSSPVSMTGSYSTVYDDECTAKIIKAMKKGTFKVRVNGDAGNGMTATFDVVVNPMVSATMGAYQAIGFIYAFGLAYLYMELDPDGKIRMTIKFVTTEQ